MASWALVGSRPFFISLRNRPTRHRQDEAIGRPSSASFSLYVDRMGIRLYVLNTARVLIREAISFTSVEFLNGLQFRDDAPARGVVTKQMWESRLDGPCFTCFVVYGYKNIAGGVLVLSSPGKGGVHYG